jgi:hypothetical protein
MNLLQYRCLAGNKPPVNFYILITCAKKSCTKNARIPNKKSISLVRLLCHTSSQLQRGAFRGRFIYTQPTTNPLDLMSSGKSVSPRTSHCICGRNSRHVLKGLVLVTAISNLFHLKMLFSLQVQGRATRWRLHRLSVTNDGGKIENTGKNTGIYRRFAHFSA